MKKILAIVLAVVMLLPVFAVNVFAADFFTLTATCDKEALDEDGAALKGWCPAVLVPWKNGDACATFKTALAKEGAVIEVVTDLKINGLTFQASPIDEKGGYPLVTLTEKLGEKTADGKVTTTFSAKAYTDLVANSKYEKDIPDVNFSFDHWNATGINTPDDRDTKLYSFKVILPEDEAESVVLVENKETKGWTNLLEGDAFTNFKTAIVKEGAKLELTYELAGESDYYNLAFEPKRCDTSLKQENTQVSVTKEKIINDIGSIDNISEFIVNPWGGKLTAKTCEVLDANNNAIASVDLKDRVCQGWTSNLLGDKTAEIVAALNKDEAKTLVLNYTMTKEGDWPGGNFHVAGKRKEVNLDKSGKMTFTLDQILANCTNGKLDRLEGIFSNCKSETGIVKYTSVVVTMPKTDKKKVSSNLAFIYVTDEYHAVLIGGRFLAMPHTDIGGYCPMCHAIIASEPVDQSVFVLETTGGQDYQDAPGTFADGVVLVDATEGGDNARIATNWIDGGKAWNGIVKAVPTEGAWLKITYTGKLNSIAFQTEKTSAPEAFEITAPAVVEEGEKNVAWFNCADIVANSPVALSGDIGGWANFMLKFEGDTTVYGFEVLVPAEAPVAE